MSILLSFLVGLVVIAWTSHVGSSQPIRHHADRSNAVFIQRHLGTLPLQPLDNATIQCTREEIIMDQAMAALPGILIDHLGATGVEDVRADEESGVYTDSAGNHHVRFHQFVDGLQVEGSALMLHIQQGDDNNINNSSVVYAVNGEFAPSHRIVTDMNLTCDIATSIAQTQLMLGSSMVNAYWKSSCEVTAVHKQMDNNGDGMIYKAYKRTLSYDGLKKVVVYAAGVDGDLLAVKHLTFGFTNITTYDCMNNDGCFEDSIYWTFVSDSSNLINVSDKNAMSAHNNALLTAEFYRDEFGRTSIDGKGKRMRSIVNVKPDPSEEVSFALFQSGYVFYSSGTNNSPSTAKFPQIIAHEWTHWFVSSTSNLFFQGIPLALNEAMCDIFASAFLRIKLRRSIKNTWEHNIGFHYSNPSAPTRVMSNPSRDYDVPGATHISELNLNPGAHYLNSGIARLAFVLMTQGGVHPLKKSSIRVKPFHSDFNTSIGIAIQLFYRVNVGCLTPMAEYAELRRCTELLATSTEIYTVQQAWAAVGLQCQARSGICTNTFDCCGHQKDTVCRRTTALSEVRKCSKCATFNQTCFAEGDCCVLQHLKCVSVSTGSTTKVCKP